MKFYFPENYGALGDGKNDDSRALQSAIDEAEKNGGGTVVLESGKTYYSSSVIMKKNVELHLQKGSVLKATSDINGYFRPCDFINDETNTLIGNPVTGKPSFAFIYAYKADNAAITGGGKIDANGHSFVKRKDKYYVTGDFYPRPTVMYFEACNHIVFEDFTVVDAPFWTLHPAGCDDVLISKIHILNDLDVANSDGIDPDHCSNVRICDCHVECADDCICLKASKGNSGGDKNRHGGRRRFQKHNSFKLCHFAQQPRSFNSDTRRRQCRKRQIFRHYNRYAPLLPRLVGDCRADSHNSV